MKSVTVELRYPGRTVEEVRAMLADPEFRQAVCTYQQVEDSAVTIEEYDDGSMTVDLDRTYGTTSSRRSPGSSSAPPSTWCSARSGSPRPRRRSRCAIPGKPGEMNGNAVLVQSGADAVETVTMDVRVGVPLVGGKLEDLVAGLLKAPSAPRTRSASSGSPASGDVS